MLSLSYNPIIVNNNGLGSSRFARRYSGNRENLLPEHNGARAPMFRINPEHDAKHLFRKKILFIAFFSYRY